MNKKIKVIELLSEISKGKNPIFKKHGGTYINSVWTFIISYFDKQMTYEEIVDWLNSEVEILEDEEEIDIQSLKEHSELIEWPSINYATPEVLNARFRIIFTLLKDIRDKQNVIIRATKQLDKKINKED